MRNREFYIERDIKYHKFYNESYDYDRGEVKGVEFVMTDVNKALVSEPSIRQEDPALTNSFWQEYGYLLSEHPSSFATTQDPNADPFDITNYVGT